MRRVVVTGMGVITPIGNSVQEFWNGIKAKKVGINPIVNFDTTQYKAKLSADVKDFDAKKYMDVKSAKRMDRFSQFAVAAAREAAEDAGLDMEKEDSFRVGISIGSGVGSLMGIEREYDKMLAKGPTRINPLTAPMVLGNMAAANVSIQFGIHGKSIDVVTACATGTNSIGEAFHAVKYGELDIMFAGGVDSSISRFGVATFQALTALTDSEDPFNASIPFDKRRNGFVTGEGAGVLILEELEHAKKRGAHIYAEIGGYGATSDANHMTAPLEDGLCAAKAMELAIKEAGMKPEDIQYINAHGTSTVYNDLFETRAIKKAFGDWAYKVKINSTKSMIGHLFGAGGAVELVTCIKSINEGYIHPTVGLKEDDPECDLDYTKGAGVYMDIRAAISNSLGFGGHNATILVKKYEE
ncbi:MAG: beta-ketoacyl-ACP synthase II [Lachnospiraceae bacterium]|nr:beta-ketoacyl-ACP synthase II [Lachnospiraceae bacterium]